VEAQVALDSIKKHEIAYAMERGVYPSDLRAIGFNQVLKFYEDYDNTRQAQSRWWLYSYGRGEY